MTLKPIVVEVEEKITSIEKSNNNTFPLWCYGAPTIVRHHDTVYATVPDTNPAIPPMCNTRVQLFRKQGEGGWQRIFVNPIYDQREPCPIASLGDGRIVVSVNSAIVPFRGSEAESWWMWYCEPYLLQFDVNADETRYPEVLKPAWEEDWPFTDHSYRGLATDTKQNELFVMNIEGYQWQPGPQGRYHWAFQDAEGRWQRNGRLEFPVRCCYPCISLKDRRVNIVAISDVDEPNREWMAYKRNFAGIPWDYDFRTLYFAQAADIGQGGFDAPVVIESFDATAGHIKHFDLFVDDEDTTHIVYLARNIRQPFMRDRFWPGQQLEAVLKVVRVQGGTVLSEQIMAQGVEDPSGRLWSHGKPAGERNTSESFRTSGLVPSHAAFQATPDGRLFVFYTLGGFDDAGQDLARNYLVEVTAGQTAEPVEITLNDPLKTFYTAPARIGSTPGYWIDLFGIGKNQPDQINYARIKIAPVDSRRQG
jgi:hypothetical protein